MNKKVFNTYYFYIKWISLTSLLLLSLSLEAQSGVSKDTTVFEGVEAREDTANESNEQIADSVIYRAAPDSAIERMQHAKEFAYANDPAYWKRQKIREPQDSCLDKLLASQVFRYFVLGLLIALLLYAIIKILLSNKILLFTPGKRLAKSGTEGGFFEEEDLTNLIAGAEQQKQYRQATRYRYLQLLRELDNRQLISLQAELTNRDYLKQLADHPLRNKFRYLTQAYEYVWYGGFEPDAFQYELLKSEFENFMR